MALNVRIEQDIKSGETARVYVEGRVDTATAPDLEKELQPLLDGSVKQLVFDLEGLEFITSAGIRVIMAARKRIAEREGSCLLVKPSAPDREGARDRQGATERQHLRDREGAGRLPPLAAAEGGRRRRLALVILRESSERRDRIRRAFSAPP